jgi:hypothetical protein
MAWLHNLLHASHFPGLEPDLNTVRMEGGLREDVLHDAAGELPTPLIMLLGDVYSESWLDVFAVLPVHTLTSCAMREERKRGL